MMEGGCLNAKKKVYLIFINLTLTHLKGLISIVQPGIEGGRALAERETDWGQRAAVLISTIRSPTERFPGIVGVLPGYGICLMEVWFRQIK